MTSDYGPSGSQRLFVSAQPDDLVDPNGERMHRGAIHLIRVTKRGVETGKLKILNRDEFPFHPFRILFVRMNGIEKLVVINYAMRHNATVEFYSIKNETLIFERRVRSELLNRPIDIASNGREALYFINDTNSLFGYFIRKRGIIHYDGESFIEIGVSGKYRLLERAKDPGILIAGDGNSITALRESSNHEMTPLFKADLRGEIGSLFSDVDSILVTVRDKKRDRIYRISFDPTNGFQKPETLLNAEGTERIDQILNSIGGYFILKERGRIDYCKR